MKKIFFALFISIVAVSAQATSCAMHYLNGQEPRINIALNMDQEICYSHYAIGYDYRSRSALYAAEHLTKQNVLAAREIERVDNFHEDPNLPKIYQVQETEYQGSQMDRGHLAPNKDFPTKQSQYESFSMANMVPQLHVHNAGAWLQIESATRYMALREGDIYVVTGGLYNKATQRLRTGSIVPNALYKAIYLPKSNVAGVYVSNNDASGTYEVISVADLTRLTGIDVFPALPDQVKQTTGKLLAPRKGKNDNDEEDRGKEAPVSLIERYRQAQDVVSAINGIGKIISFSKH